MNQKDLSGFKILTGLIFSNCTNSLCLLYFTNDFAFSTAAANPERSLPPAVA